ncbi:MAG: hypothetical protein AAF589_04220 [Planctomycetota bacterium]
MPTSSESQLRFAATVDRIFDTVVENIDNLEALRQAIDEYRQSVFIKNESQVIVAVNKSFGKFFAGDHAIGRHARSFLDPSIQRVSLYTDEMILTGTQRVGCVHAGAAVDGYYYTFLMHKRSLASLRRPGFMIFGVTQAEERLDKRSQHVELTRLTSVFRDFEQRDRDICRLAALGKTGAEIGEELGMTSRNVEIRRKKAFVALGVDKPVDLARLLVRLQERGHVDLGL